MKKTLITLLALAGVACGADSVTLTSSYSGNGNYNIAMHGFWLSLSSDEFVKPEGVVTLPETAVLESLTVTGATDAQGAGDIYGFVVLGETDNTVLGMSTGTLTCAQNTNLEFSFVNMEGGALTLNTADVYRFVAVSGDVLDMFADTEKTYVYNGGGKGAALSETSGNTVTISQGLKAPGLRTNYSADYSGDDYCLITNPAINNKVGANNPLVNATITIPEPATATLSLLALAGLAARRRRK